MSAGIALETVALKTPPGICRLTLPMLYSPWNFGATDLQWA